MRLPSDLAHAVVRGGVRLSRPAALDFRGEWGDRVIWTDEVSSGIRATNTWVA
jgi:hypothetical protein